MFFVLKVSLALFILFLYMVMGAAIFTYTDDWKFSDSLYFVFVSISTIGFGDLTPKSEWSMIALSIYLLFGLALTSMCINVIQEQLAVAFEQTKVRLGTRMGFDIDQLNMGQIESGTSGNSDDKGNSKESAGKKEQSNKNDSTNRNSSLGKKSVTVSDSNTTSSSGDRNNNKSTTNTTSSSNKKDKISSTSQLSSKLGKNNTSSVSDTVSQAKSSSANKTSVSATNNNNPSTGFALKSDSLGKNLKERREQLKKKPEQVTNTNSFQESSNNNLSAAIRQENNNKSQITSLPSSTTADVDVIVDIEDSSSSNLLQPVAPKRAKSPRRP